jgi:hypothetical protein
MQQSTAPLDKSTKSRSRAGPACRNSEGGGKENSQLVAELVELNSSLAILTSERTIVSTAGNICTIPE